MTKIQIVVLCIAVSFVSSVVTSIVTVHYFPPKDTALISGRQSVGALSFAMTPMITVASQSAFGIQGCKDDTAKFCDKDTDPLPTRCLQEHFDEVSAGCHKTLQTMRDGFSPCKNEITKYCANVGYGGGRMNKCLRENKAYLSDACARIVGK